MTNKPKVLVVVGPTASGKTGLAIALAKECDGEVISADSRQVYRGLDVGTAKVTTEEMKGVPHHLIDVTDVSETYSVIDFKRDAAAAITDITSRHKVPIIAGGTFFYTDTLLGRISTPAVPPNEALRAQLETQTTEQLAATLQNLDPKRASTIDIKNPRRLIRAIEIAEALGSVPDTAPPESPYEVLMLGIETDRDELRQRIADRAPQWLEAGLEAEIVGLLAAGVSRERLHEIGFEYQVGLELVDKTITREEFLEKITQKNWQYAKRQLTWLKRDKSILWHGRTDTETILRHVKTFLHA